MINRAVSRAILYTVAASLCLAPAAQGSSSPRVIPILVRGQALDQDSQPLSAATVELRVVQSSHGSWVDDPPPSPVDVARTDTDGRFELRAPGEGPWLVRIAAKGRQAQRFQLLALVGDRTLPPVTLRQTRPVLVQIRDLQGEPIDGAWLLPPQEELSPEQASGTWQTELLRQQSAQSGELSVPVPLGGGPEAPWTIEHSAFSPAAVDLVEDLVRVRLSPTSLTPGRLQLLSGYGRASWAAGTLLIPPQRRAPVAVVSEDEISMVTGIDRDLLALQFLTAGGGRPALIRLELGEEEGSYRAKLPEPHRAPIRVIDGESGGGVAGAFVWLEDDPGVWTTSNSEGFLTLEQPLGSHFRVGLDASGYLPSFQPIVSRPGKPPVLQLHPAASMVVTAHGTDGRPIAGLESRLRLLPRTNPALRRERPQFRFGLSSEGDELTLTKLIPGATHELTLRAPGFAEATHTWTPEAGTAQRVALTLSPEHRLVGSVITHEEKAIPGAEVLVLRAVGAANRRRAALGYLPRDAALATEEAGELGQFEIGGLPQGPFDLIVRKRGFSPAVLAGVSFGPGTRDRNLGVIRLSPTIEMKGQVVANTGEAVEGARVFVIYRVDRPGGGGSELPRDRGRPANVTQDGGEFSISNLEAGPPFTLGVWKEGYLPHRLEGLVPAVNEMLRVELSAGSKLEGKVLDRSGNPLPGAKLEITQAGGVSGVRLVTLYGSAPAATTGADGSFELSGLLPGSATLEVRAAGYQRRTLACGAKPKLSASVAATRSR